MAEKKLRKKITSFILVISMIFISFTMPNSTFATETVYDFSDAAQAEFDAQENIIINNSPDGLVIETQKIEKPKRRKKAKKEQTKTIDKITTDNKQVPPQTLAPEVQNYIDYRASVFEQQDPILKGQVVYITAGASFNAILQSSISSASLTKGDTIAAVLQDDWYHNSVLIAPQGSIVYGRAVETEKARGGYGNGSLSILFDELLTPKGDKLLLTSNVVEIVVENKRWWKVAANIVGGAAVGALIGVMMISDDDDNSKGAIIGASAGGIMGGVRAATQKGEEVEVPAGTVINVRLVQPMNATPYNEM